MNQIIIGLVGLPACGKSTLGKKISSELGISHINKDKYRDFFIENVTYFHGTVYSRRNPKIKIINDLLRPMTDKLIMQLLDNGESVIIDGYGKTKESRDFYRNLLKSYDIKTVIIYVKEKEEVILERLKKRDEKNSDFKWVESYWDRWKPTFSVPSKEECDLFIEVDDANANTIIEKIKEYSN